MKESKKNKAKNIHPEKSKEISLKSSEVSKLIKTIKSADSSTPSLRPRKSKRAKVAIISTASVAVAGAGIGTAVYIANQSKEYVITIHYQGGVAKEMKANQVKDLNAPEVPGYSFAGWYKDSSYSVRYKSNDRFDEDCHVFGYYVKNEYIVEFKNEGADFEIKNVLFDSSFVFPTIDEEDENEANLGHKFVGWATESEPDVVYSANTEFNMNVVGGMTFHAVWEKETYTVEIRFTDLLDIAGSKDIDTFMTEFEYCTAIEGLRWDVKHKDYSKVFVGYKYRFNDQNYDIKQGDTRLMPAGDIVIEPLFEDAKVNLVLNYNDNNTSNFTHTLIYNVSQAFELPTPTREGYVFKGWARKRTWDINAENVSLATETFTLNSNTDTGSVTLYAIWAHRYKILDPNGNGEVEEVYTFTSEFEFVNNARKDNYTFKGFMLLDSDGNPIGEYITSPYQITNSTPKFEGVVVLKPIFVANSKTLKFDLNNTDFYKKDINKIYKDEIEITNLDGKTMSHADDVKSFEMPTLTSRDNFNSQNYMFKGWSTDEYATSGVYSYTLPDTDIESETITYYAIWEEASVEVDINIVGSDYGTVKIYGVDVTKVSAPYGSEIKVSGRNTANPGFEIGGINVSVAVKDDYKNDYAIQSISASEVKLTKKTILEIKFGEYENVTLKKNVIKDSNGEETPIYNLSLDEETIELNGSQEENPTQLPVLVDEKGNYDFLGWATRPAGSGIPDIYTDGRIILDENYNGAIYAIWQGKVVINVTLELGSGCEGLSFSESAETEFQMRYGDSVVNDLSNTADSNLKISSQMDNGSHTFNTIVDLISGKNSLWKISLSAVAPEYLTEDTTIVINNDWLFRDINVEFKDKTSSTYGNLTGTNKSMVVPSFETVAHTHVSSWGSELRPGQSFNPYALTQEQLGLYGFDQSGDWATPAEMTIVNDREWNTYIIELEDSEYFTTTLIDSEFVRVDGEKYIFTCAENNSFNGFDISFAVDKLGERINSYQLYINGEYLTTINNESLGFAISCLPNDMESNSAIEIKNFDVWGQHKLVFDYTLSDDPNAKDSKVFGDIEGGVYTKEYVEQASINIGHDFAIETLNRENYHLLGFSATKNATECDPGLDIESLQANDFKIHVGVGETKLYPVWEGNSRWFVITGTGYENGEWLEDQTGLNYIDSNSLPNDLTLSYKQGQEITLPQVNNPYIKDVSFRYNGRTYSPGAKIVINKTDGYASDGNFDMTNINNFCKIELEIVYSYKTAYVTFITDGGDKVGEFEDGYRNLGTTLSGLTCTYDNNTKYFAGWDVYVDEVLKAEKVSEFTIDTEGNYRVEAVFEDVEFKYQFVSNVGGGLPSNNDSGFSMNGSSDIVLDFYSSDFVCEGYKFSHFEFIRNGVVETAYINGSFKNVVETVENPTESYTFTIKAVFVAEGQLLTFHTVTTPDELECVLSSGEITRVNKQSITVNSTTYRGAQFILPRANEEQKQINGETYYFVGWSTDLDGDVDRYPGETWLYDQEYLDFYPVYEKIDETAFVFRDIDVNMCEITGVSKSLPHYIVPDVHSSGKQVVGIASNAFSGRDLKYIHIPQTLKYIKSDAFSGCVNLISVCIDNESSISTLEYRTFKDCSSLKTINLPQNINSIGDELFRGCSSLVRINIPKAVEKIGWHTFRDCENLKSVVFEEDSELTEIGHNAFDNCSNLENIVIPSKVESILSSSFTGCTSLRSVDILSNVLTFIGTNVFRNCESLENIILPASLTTLDSAAFVNCTSLESINIPSGVASLNYQLFEGCTNLKSVELAESGLVSIGSYAFKNCEKLETLLIPSTVTSIGTSEVFLNCKSLHNVINLSSLKFVHGVDFENSYMIFNSEVVWDEADDEYNETTGLTYRTYYPKSGSTIRFWVNGNNVEQTKEGSFKVLISSRRPDDSHERFFSPDMIDSDTDGFASKLFSYGHDQNSESASDLRFITLPESLKSIGYSTFGGCYRLEVVCNLSNIDISDISHISGNGYISYYLGEVYNEKVSVEEITINDIRYYDVFNESGNRLDRIVATFNAGVSGEIVLDENTTVVSYKAFENVPITKVTIPESVRLIQYKAFNQDNEPKTEVVLNNTTGWQQYKNNEWSNLDPSVVATTITNNPGLVYRRKPSSASLNGVNYTVHSSGAYAVVSGLSNTNLEHVEIASSYLGLPVRNIGASAFANNTKMKTISIPSSVRSIAGYAFKNCTALESIIVPEKVTAIGEQMFYGCSSLTSVVFEGNEITRIGYNAFNGCTNLKSITLPTGKLKEIQDRAFYNTGIESIVIPASVNKFGAQVFVNCGLLKSVTFAANSELTSLNLSIFGSNNNIESFIFEEGSQLTSITRTFNGWAKLKNISIPKGVTSLAANMFDGCTSLENVTFENGSVLTTIGNFAFQNCPSLREIAIPKGVTTLSNTFKGCTNLETVIIPEDSELTSIGFCTFRGCGKLENINMPNKLTSIGSEAFYDCYSLETILIPAGVTTIGAYAFTNCRSLHTVMNLSPNFEYVHGVHFVDSYMIFNSEVVWEDSERNEYGLVYRIYRPKPGTGEVVKFITQDNRTIQEQTSFKVLISSDGTKTMFFHDMIDSDTDAFASSLFNYDNDPTTSESASGLRFVTLPENLKSIGYSTFGGCYRLGVVCNLSRLEIGNISRVEGYAFISYYIGEVYTEPVNVQEVEIGGVKYYEVYNLSGNMIDKIVVAFNQPLTPNGNGAVVLDLDTTVIAYKAFDGANITSITIPENVRLTQYAAFRASGLEAINLVDSEGWQYYNSGEWVDIEPENVATMMKENPGLVFRKLDNSNE